MCLSKAGIFSICCGKSRGWKGKAFVSGVSWSKPGFSGTFEEWSGAVFPKMPRFVHHMPEAEWSTCFHELHTLETHTHTQLHTSLSTQAYTHTKMWVRCREATEPLEAGSRVVRRLGRRCVAHFVWQEAVPFDRFTKVQFRWLRWHPSCFVES